MPDIIEIMKLGAACVGSVSFSIVVAACFVAIFGE